MIAIHVMISFPVVLCRNTLPIVGVVTILFHFAFLFAYLITKFFSCSDTILYKIALSNVENADNQTN